MSQTSQTISQNSGIGINNTGEFILHGDITQINNLYQVARITGEEQAQLLARAEAHLARMPLDGQIEIAPLPTGSRMPYRANPLFVGRQEELKQLAKITRMGQNSIIAATGIGGMGKSQLALAFAHQYGHYFAGGVYWVSMADAATVPSEVAQCGGGHLDPQFLTLPLPDQVRLVRQNWQEALPRLLIFDNCETESLLTEWLPTSGGARVLVTSRRGQWDVALGMKTLPLSTLTREQSVALLRQLAPQFGAEQWQAGLEAVARELGDFPLALHLAGSYLGKYGVHLPPDKLLAELRSEGLRSRALTQHAHHGVNPTGHEWAVARTFELSFGQLTITKEQGGEINEVTVGLLARAAWFAPGEVIENELLFLTMGGGEVETLTLVDGLARLVDLGLLERVGETGVQLHRLLGLFVREAVGENVAEAAQETVEVSLGREAERLNGAGDPRALQSWVNHLQHITTNAEARQDERAAWLGNTLGNYLIQVGDYQGAWSYVEQALAIRKVVLGEQHPYTAQSLNNLGVLLIRMGKYKEARPYQEQVLAISQAVLGEENPNTVLSFHGLGTTLFHLEEYEEAQSYLKRGLASSMAVLGEENMYTASILNSLGLVLARKGEYVEAQPYYEKALSIQQAVLGEEHPDTAQTINNLGALLFRMKQYALARPYYEQALAIRQKVLGAEHPDTAQILINLGGVLNHMDEYREARPYFEQALAIQRSALGEQHPEIAISFNNLGKLLYNMEEYEEARSYYEQALAIAQKLGAENRYTTAILHNLAVLCYKEGDVPTAVALMTEALTIQEKMLGTTHPDTQTTRERLATMQSGQP